MAWRGSGSALTWLFIFSVPQASVLGPILFLLYSADLAKLVESHGLRVHLYGDDTQVAYMALARCHQLISYRSACRPASTT